MAGGKTRKEEKGKAPVDKKGSQDEKGKDGIKKQHKPFESTRVVPRTIVRIAGKDLNGDHAISRAISTIKGISHRTGRLFAIALENETGIPADSKLSAIKEDNVKKLEDIIMNPGAHGIPEWCLNRRKDYASGKSKHLSMNELDFDLRNTLKRLGEIKSYRGLRHAWGLPVRGQRTKSTHRHKGGTVGVQKKDTTKPASAPAKSGK